MEKTIFFHIGTVKTGTTFIQKFCYDNPDFLLKNDLAYPYVTPAQIHLPRFANADFLNSSDLHEEAKAMLDEVPQSRILISEEGLMGRPERINLPVFDDFSKRVILYLRPPADLVAAWAAEKAEPYNAAVDLIEDQYGLFSIEKGISYMMMHYIASMNEVMSILSTLEPGQVFVRPFERSQFIRGSLLLDFFSVFNINVPYVDTASFNPTRTRKYCDVSHTVWTVAKELGVPHLFDYPLVRSIYADCRSGDDRPVVDTLSNTVIETICSQTEYIETHFSERYLDGRPLFANRFPKNYLTKRADYDPLDRSEVEHLARAAINKKLC